MIDIIDDNHDQYGPHCTICHPFPLAAGRPGYYVPGNAFGWSPKLPEMWPDNGWSDHEIHRGPMEWVDDWGCWRKVEP